MDPTIKVGDRVRSYDFPERRDDPDRPQSYVEGTVTALVEREGCMRYEIRVDKRVVGGDVIDMKNVSSTTVYPPVNGTPTTGGRRTDGVIRALDPVATVVLIKDLIGLLPDSALHHVEMVLQIRKARI